MDDIKIIDLFFARSELAIEALDGKYGAICHNLSRSILKDQQDAEECVNDAYLGVWNAIPPHRPNPLSVFVCKIVRNISMLLMERAMNLEKHLLRSWMIWKLVQAPMPLMTKVPGMEDQALCSTSSAKMKISIRLPIRSIMR